MLKIGRSTQEKIEFAKKLVGEGLSYQDIQVKLRDRFGSGMSNSTLKQLREVNSKLEGQSDQIRQLEQELSLFKKAYFELLDKTERKETTQKLKEDEQDESNSKI